MRGVGLVGLRPDEEKEMKAGTHISTMPGPLRQPWAIEPATEPAIGLQEGLCSGCRSETCSKQGGWALASSHPPSLVTIRISGCEEEMTHTRQIVQGWVGLGTLKACSWCDWNFPTS